MNMTISEAQTMVDQWINTTGVRYFDEMTNTALLMEEVGELARIMARKYGEQSFKPGEKQEDAGAEMADVLFVLLCLANQTNVDLSKALQDSMLKKNQRDFDRHKNNPKLRD
jgi:NTP pyrophosphatase (non-canonical NTP hydrolase)